MVLFVGYCVQEVVKVVQSRGTNIFEVEFAPIPPPPPPPTAIALADVPPSLPPSPLALTPLPLPSPSPRRELVMMPNKFKKLIWIKRGDYLIVGTSTSVSSADAAGLETATASLASTITATITSASGGTGVGSSGSSGSGGSSSGVKYMVRHVLSKDQVKHIKAEGCWPWVDEVTAAGADAEQVNSSAGTTYAGYSIDAGYGMDMGMGGHGLGSQDGDSGDSGEDSGPGEERVDAMGNTIYSDDEDEDEDAVVALQQNEDDSISRPPV
jgi:hypothetical protein